LAEDGVAGEASLLEEVVARPQIPIVARRLLEEESLDRSEGNRKTRALPPDSLEGKDRLVPQKTVVASEGFDQRFDRGGRRNSRQGSGNVSANPPVLFLVLEEVGQGGDRVLAVAHQRLSSGVLQASIPHQRNESGDEEEIGIPQEARAPDRLFGDTGIGVVHHRQEELPESRVGGAGDGPRRFAPRGGHSVPALAPEIRKPHILTPL